MYDHEASSDAERFIGKPESKLDFLTQSITNNERRFKRNKMRRKKGCSRGKVPSSFGSLKEWLDSDSLACAKRDVVSARKKHRERSREGVTADVERTKALVAEFRPKDLLKRRVRKWPTHIPTQNSAAPEFLLQREGDR